jgi:putative peptide zinc metalloprotease protein
MLSTPALGWAGGGPIPVDSSDSQGLRTSEPFFRVECDVPIVDQLAMVHGRTGKIRFRIDDEPLLSRWLRRFRQLLQKRYQF